MSIMRAGGKGQSSLEYLLIIVLISAIALAVMAWTQIASDSISNETAGETYNIRCATTDCVVDEDCNSVCGAEKAECVIPPGEASGLCQLK